MWRFMLAASRRDPDQATSAAPGLLAGRKGAGLLVLVAMACCAWLTAGPLVGVSRAATCATSWANPVTGSWSNAADWTRGVPTSGENACITVPGNYTVTLLDGQSAASLTLGSSSGATTQVLRLTAVPGHNADLSVGANSTVNATGEIVMDSQSEGGNTQISGPSTATLTNRGTIDAQVEGSELNFLEVDLTNDGVVEVKSGELRQDDNTTTTNNGTFTVASGVTPGFTMTTASDLFVNHAGTVSNGGAITLTNGSSWHAAGGSEARDPVTMFSGTLTDNGAGSSGAYTLLDNVTFSGTVAAKETLDVTGVPGRNSDLSFGGATATNNGTIVMDSQSGGGYTQLSDGTLHSNGKLDAQVEGSQLNYLEVDLANDGVVDVKSGELRQDDNTITNNDGNVILEAQAQFNLITGEDVFNQQSHGSMTFDIASATSFGTMNLSNGATFNLEGGTANPILASGYSPPVGTEYAVVTGPWGSGTFTTVTHDFSGDYTHATFLGLVRG